MRITIVLAGALALAACGGDEAAAPETADEAASEAAATSVDPADVGLFEISSDDGGTVMHRRMADGTFTDSADGEDLGGGAWRRNEDGAMCFGQNQGDAEEACWVESEPREDGSWTAMASNGDTVIVRRVTEPDAAE
ncbi:hypothetical protein [Erythrobacter sp. EC-HK427]|uniref:hypothetical protein n=1 Tax=Erythrobacter sp. EC-HK427 TaxID=2038396 RepID=UPI0012554AAD|nr:hypothetical protein [Erythrobacter sp. EC-HK427]VVT16287.1 conserved exported hypothetical protein [Erythrobacter sp. EC-HK427]